MKTFLSLFFLLILCEAGTTAARAQESVSIDFFYDNLDPYGDWREVGSYGYCWQPRNVEQDWQPYSDGRWVYTDAGWTWDSDEPYGWAVYHYGRWVSIVGVGWLWIPGIEWGPGWVSWRHSTDYVGWAPLPPEARFRRSTGLSAWVDDYYDIGPDSYRFIETRDFGAPRLRFAFLDRSRNTTFIRQTTNITNISWTNEMVHNGGPDYDRISQASSRPVSRYKLDRRETFEGDRRAVRTEDLKSRIDGGSLRMFAAPFRARAESGPKKLESKISDVEINHGWKRAGTPAQIQELRTATRGKVKPPEDLPRRPKFEKASDGSSPAPERQPAQKAPESRGKKGDDSPPRPLVRPPATPEKKLPPAARPPAPKADPPKAPRESPNPPAAREKPQPRPAPREKIEPRQQPKPEARPKSEPKPEPQKPAPDKEKGKGNGKGGGKGKDKSEMPEDQA